MSTYDANRSVSRRAFVGAAAGGAALGAAGAAAGQEEGEGTTEGGDGTEGGQGTEGEGEGGGGGGTEEVIVGPGGDLVFEPSDLEITPGTTVNFVWESDMHNVVPDGQPEDANWEGEGADGTTYDTGHEYSHTFEVEGDYEYYCEPHLSAGMEGSITVSADAGGGASRPQISNSALTLGVATTGVLASTLALAFFFLKYGGDYEGAE